MNILFGLSLSIKSEVQEFVIVSFVLLIKVIKLNEIIYYSPYILYV